MPIDFMERNRRLDENHKHLRRKIREMGLIAFANAVLGPIERDIVSLCGDLRFMADTWIDKDGDVISERAKKEYFSRRGIEYKK